MRTRLFLLSALAALVVAVPASAKEGVKATLTSSVPIRAAAGKQITVSWTLTYVAEGHRYFFGAGGVFIRLLSASGARPTSAKATGSDGHYSASVRVPRGRIGGIRIGLHAFNDYGTADMFFPITNNPFRKK